MRIQINYFIRGGAPDLVAEIELPESFPYDPNLRPGQWEWGRQFLTAEAVDTIRTLIADYRAEHGLEPVPDITRINYRANEENITVLPDATPAGEPETPATEGPVNPHTDLIRARFNWYDGTNWHYHDVREVEVPSPCPAGPMFAHRKAAEEAFARIEPSLDPGSRVELSDSRAITVIRRGTPAPIEPIADGAPEGYVTHEALQRVMFDLARENNWCSDHHVPMRDLGVQPLRAAVKSTITVEVPVEMVLRSGFGGSYSLDTAYLRLKREGAALDAAKQKLAEALNEMLYYSSELPIRRDGRPRDSSWEIIPAGIGDLKLSPTSTVEPLTV